MNRLSLILAYLSLMVSPLSFAQNQPEYILKKAVIEGSPNPHFCEQLFTTKISKKTFFDKNFFEQKGLSADNQFVQQKWAADAKGGKHYFFRQTYQQIPIEGASIRMHEFQDVVQSWNGHFIGGLEITSKPTLTEQTALKYALQCLEANKYAWQNSTFELALKGQQENTLASFYPKGELVIFSPDFDTNPDSYQLCYKFDIYALDPLERSYVYVHAHTGEVVGEINRLHHAEVSGAGISNHACTNPVQFTTDFNNGIFRLRIPSRKIFNFNCLNTWSYLSVSFTDTDNLWIEDKTAVDIHYATEEIRDYFLSNHGWVSYNGNNAPIYNFIHYGNNFKNAYFDGNFFVYGDGDNQTFQTMSSLDVVAHEYTHAITENTADLIYKNEPGALSESFSDIFAVVIEHYLESECADWIVGEDIVVKEGKNGIRNLANPKDSTMLTVQPDTYYGEHWYQGSKDNGGVHTNCGAHSYAFYLLANGGSGVNDHGQGYSISGIGIDKAAQIFFHNLQHYLFPTAGYIDARNGAILSAIDLYGTGSNEVEQVSNAFCAIGLGLGNCEILDNELNMVRPTAEDIWHRQSVQSIEWITSGNISHVKLEYSINGGLNWQLITESTANMNSYDWIVPDVSTSLAKIKVTALNDETVVAVSENFVIQGCHIVAGFTESQTAICAGDTLAFLNTSVFAEDYLWRIDMIEQATTTDFEYIFEEEGVYMVELIATGDNCSDSFYEAITVYTTPYAHFSDTHNGLTVGFAPVLTSGDTYEWMIDSVAVSLSPQLEYNFEEEGIYEVCLEVGVNECGSNRICRMINVQEAAIVNCLTQDSLALVALYHQTNGNSWLDNSGWLTQPLSEWKGVTLTGDACSVKSIQLNNNNLTGSIPTKIEDLQLLEKLQLDSNQITGAILTEIGELNHLQFLSLQNNQLADTIPTEIGSLTNLDTLSLQNNLLEGEIPPSMGNLTQLYQLQLNGNSLSGAIPTELTNLLQLKDLNLSENQLSNGLPTPMDNWSNLEILALSHNQLSGSIPTSIGNLSNLKVLSLDNNQLTGTLPTEIGNLSQLEVLWLQNNQVQSPIPTELSAISSLKKVNLNNNQLNFSGLEELYQYFENNANFTELSYILQDTIPTHLYTDYETLYVEAGGNSSNNTYSWYEVGNPTPIVTNIGNGSFTPSNDGWYYCEISNSVVTQEDNVNQNLMLRSDDYEFYTNCLAKDSLALVAIYNAMDGPNWTYESNFHGVIAPNLGNEWLVGPVSQWHGVVLDEDSCRVTRLILNYIKMRGAIPLEVNQLTKLERLDLSSNFSITGAQSLDGLKNLKFLDLELNSIGSTYPIPSLNKLKNLDHLDVSYNSYITSIPPLDSLTKLRTFNCSYTTNLTYIPTLENLESLENFICQNSPKLESISGLENLLNLKNLQIQYCKIKEFPISENNILLGGFHAQGNRIKDLPSLEFLDSFTELKYFRINNNNLTFKDIEKNLNYINVILNYDYTPQLSTPTYLHSDNQTLYVKAGGTLTNNTYHWFLSGQSDTLSTAVGDSTFTPNISGNYYCKVSNSVVTDLTLTSQTFPFTKLPECLEADSLVLTMIYEALDGDNWVYPTWDGTPNWNSPIPNKGNPWLQGPVSEWHGVTIDEVSGGVEKLNLYFMNLNGTIPIQVNSLCYLTEINCHDNPYFEGFESLFGATNLQRLNLLETAVESLPTLQNLHSLEYLNVGNTLMNNLPDLDNLTALKELDCSFINDGLDLTELPSLEGLSSLETLNCSDNLNLAELPNLDSLTYLKNLIAFNCDLTQIPDLSQLDSLEQLEVQSNYLSSLPSLDSLNQLQHLDASDNQLTALPNLENLSNLETLNLTDNQLDFQDLEEEADFMTNLLNNCPLSANCAINYQNQATIPLHLHSDNETFYVKAGGKTAHNTYTWFEEGLTDTVYIAIGDSTFVPDASGTYYCQVANNTVTQANIATQNLVLTSEAKHIFAVPNCSLPLDLGEDRTLCADSLILVANLSEMQSYAWQLEGDTIGNGQSLIAYDSGNYKLIVTNQCNEILTDSISLTLDKNCVFPGDFNYDGIVDNHDLLQLGLHFGESGFVRPNASFNWEGQHCPDWDAEQDNFNVNTKHIDGNGDGLLDLRDKDAIDINYGKTHGFAEGDFDTNSPISIVPTVSQYPTIFDENTIIEIDLNLVNDIVADVTAYGIAFDVRLLLPPNAGTIKSVQMDFSNSWVGKEDVNLLTLSHWNEEGTMEIGVTKIDHENATGSGPLGTVRAIIAVESSVDTLDLTLNIEAIQMITSNATLIPVGGQAQTLGIYSDPSQCQDQFYIEMVNKSYFPALIHARDSVKAGNLDGSGPAIIPSYQQVQIKAGEKIILEPGTDIQGTTTLSIQACPEPPVVIADKKDDKEESLPLSCGDLRAYPNPVTTYVYFDFHLCEKSAIQLSIYDIHGRLIKVLANQEREAGRHKAHFEPCNMPSGMYVVKLNIDGKEQITKKFIKK